jgi:hypothetical protein
MARSARKPHEAIAIAMNRLGGRSNTGEAAKTRPVSKPADRRLEKTPPSSRCLRPPFGVTSESCQCPGNPDQDGPGAKPGEGGQLPARRSTPGWRRPPHHPWRLADLAGRSITTSIRSKTSTELIRPQECQQICPDQRQAGLGSWRWHDCRRCGQGPRRCGPGQRL